MDFDSPLTEASLPVTQSTHVRPPWLWIARGVWLAVAVAYLIPSVVNARDFVNDFLYLRGGFETTFHQGDQPLAAASFSKLGIPFAPIPWILLIVQVLPLLTLWVTAALIFWRKSDHRVGLLTSFALLTLGAKFGPAVPYFLNQPLTILLYGYILQYIWWPALLVMLFIFPTGRSVPRYAASIVAALAYPASIGLASLIPTGTAMAPIQNIITMDKIWNPLLPISVAIGGISQIYRFWRVSGRAERQQAKWVMIAAASYTVVVASNWLVDSMYPGFMTYVDPGYAVFRVTFAAATGLTLSIIPLAIAVALFRYRLWDVDFVINRALVLGVMALLFVALAAGSLFAISHLAANLPGGPLVGVAVGAAIFGVAFNPVYNECRKFVDRRLYGIRLDYVEAARADDSARQDAARVARSDTLTSFGVYTGLTLIGRGGMGEVYRGVHPTLNRVVAIKILPERQLANPNTEKRFDREAQTIARLKHPNVITLYDVGEHQGTPFMVMEYIDGKDLSDLIRERGRLALSDALPILADISAALDYSHSQGVIHRDIKPSNVMIETVTATGSGRSTRAILMDFGIARSYASMTRLTHSGVIGTLDYISPEQIQGATEIDARADIYSFGVMTFQTLTGRLPFVHGNPGAMVLAHLNQPPPDPREIAPDVPAVAAQALLRAMNKKPEDRFVTAGEFVAAVAG